MGGISRLAGESLVLLPFHTRSSTPQLLLSLMDMPWPCHLQYLGSPLNWGWSLLAAPQGPPTLPHDARPQPLSIGSFKPSKPVPWDFTHCQVLQPAWDTACLDIASVRRFWDSAVPLTWRHLHLSGAGVLLISCLSSFSWSAHTDLVQYATQTTPIPVSRESSVWNLSQGSTVCQSLSILIF